MQTILYPKPQYARVRCAVSTTIFSASLILELDDLRLTDAEGCDRPPPPLSMNRLASFDVRFDKCCILKYCVYVCCVRYAQPTLQLSPNPSPGPPTLLSSLLSMTEGSVILLSPLGLHSSSKPRTFRGELEEGRN